MIDGSLFRPTKLLWLLPLPSVGQHWSSVIPSRSVRELVKQTNNILDSSHISRLIVPLTETLYSEWHAFYSHVMTSQNHDVIASPQWFAQKRDVLSKIYLLDFKSETTEERVGASIISENNEGVFTHHFRASVRADLKGPPNTSLGIFLDLVFIDFAYSQGATRVSAGLSRNGFGHFNTVGYLASKLRMGYIPEGAKDRPWDAELPGRNSTTPTAWFVHDNQQGLTLLMSPSINGFQGEIITYLNRLHIPYKEYQEEQA